MTIYLNLKTNLGTETVDEFSRETSQSPKDFRKYVNDMVNEYRLAGMSVYKSSRSTKEWRNK
jgi:hypothetical protein